MFAPFVAAVLAVRAVRFELDRIRRIVDTVAVPGSPEWVELCSGTPVTDPAPLRPAA